jgi:hypothetical protein
MCCGDQLNPPAKSVVHGRSKKLNLAIVVKKRKNPSPGSLWRWGVKANASSEGNEMNRLRRFYEKVPYGRASSRVAYVTNRAALPEALPDAEWAEDAAFNAGDAILADPRLKDVYKEAILKGCAMVPAIAPHLDRNISWAGPLEPHGLT